MMAASSKPTVGTLAEALDQVREVQGAHGFLIAPLSRTSGGARSWHALGDDGRRWIPENDEGAEVPVLNEIVAEELPRLPLSKLNLWAVIGVALGGDTLKPEVILDPRLTETESPAVSSRFAKSPPPPPAPPPPVDVVQALLQALHVANEDVRKMSEEGRLSLRTAREELTSMAEVREKEMARVERRATQADNDRNEVLKANSELSSLVAELKARSETHATIRELFAGKPELLISAAKEFFDGIFAHIK